MDPPSRVDPLQFTMRWPVRGYELASNGHVNNAVYLSWAEELATAHAEAAGYGRAFLMKPRQKTWLGRISGLVLIGGGIWLSLQRRPV